MGMLCGVKESVGRRQLMMPGENAMVSGESQPFSGS
jgi:hypothetical protein